MIWVHGGEDGGKKGWWFGRCSAFGDCVCHVLEELRSVAIGINTLARGPHSFIIPSRVTRINRSNTPEA